MIRVVVKEVQAADPDQSGVYRQGGLRSSGRTCAAREGSLRGEVLT